MAPTVRAVALTNYVEVARFAGLDPYEMLRNARIAPDQLDDPECRLPASAAVMLMAESARLSGRADFALLVAECRTFASLGPISLLLEHQPSLRAMIATITRFQRHMNDIVTLAVDDDGETAIIRTHIQPNYADPQAVECAIAVFYRTLSEVMRGRWQPDSVHFTHRAPADTSTHRRLFQCRIEFDAEFDGFASRSALLDLPKPDADPAMARNAERLLSLVHGSEPEGTTAERARRAIYLLIHSGSATIERVADNLGLHVRTLQRALDKDGWSFAALLNDVRRELAQRYLASEHHSIATVAHLAGYSHQSAFTRWFAAEFGSTPAAWRSGGTQATVLA